MRRPYEKLDDHHIVVRARIVMKLIRLKRIRLKLLKELIGSFGEIDR